jgi:1-acyl-sn-glycerol-3-phosphate acyltransferase
MALLFAVEYRGLENVPDEGAVIIAGNHPSYLDPVLVALPISRVVRFMAWDALFKIPVLGPLIRSLGAFPVDVRRGKGEAAYREACRVLESGDALGIFPEGQRSERGPMGELRTGVARLAIETGAPIVPVTIGGAYRAWPRWRLLPKPAKIIVRYHSPIVLDETERASRAGDKQYHQQVMDEVAGAINRSLAPALRGSEALERLYRQPPSHIRSYEWVPLATAIVAAAVASARGATPASPRIWFAPAIYYAYLASDLLLIRQTRTAKWIRNSMPLWLIYFWHYPLTTATGLPEGRDNALLAAIVLLVFFPFFWEDYYRLQRFIRGLVVVYYSSLALELRWPDQLAVLVAVTGFIVLFSVRYRTVLRWTGAGLALLGASYSIWSAGGFGANGAIGTSLAVYIALSVAALLYLNVFASVAYDIRSVRRREDG